MDSHAALAQVMSDGAAATSALSPATAVFAVDQRNWSTISGVMEWRICALRESGAIPGDHAATAEARARIRTSIVGLVGANGKLARGGEAEEDARNAHSVSRNDEK
jgi:hypothetical protein